MPGGKMEAYHYPRESGMITLRDCIEYLRLTPEEVDAIAEHEHVAPIVAAELASYLVETPDGDRLIKRMILDDIMHAAGSGDTAQVARLTDVLKHFVATHPELR